MTRKSVYSLRISCFPNFPSRPAILFSLVLVVSLVVALSRRDREWNRRVQGLDSFPSVTEVLGCSRNTTHFCCQAERQSELQALYAQEQRKTHPLVYTDMTIYVSTFGVVTCVISCLVELVILGKIDPENQVHRRINEICGATYIICIFLLIAAMVNMAPGKIKDGDLCGTTDEPFSADVELMIDCFLLLGSCQNPTTLLLALIFIIGYPIICFIIYYAVECMSDVCNPDASESSGFIKFESAGKVPTNPSTFGAKISKSRTEMCNFIGRLGFNSNHRTNGTFLSRIGLCLQNNIRSGSAPRISKAHPPPPSPTSTTQSNVVLPGVHHTVHMEYAGCIGNPSPPPKYEEALARCPSI